MSRFLNSWAIAHRNGKAIFTAISLLGILIWALVLKEQASSHQLLKTETVISTITDMKKHRRVHSSKYGKTVFEMYKYWIKLPDGKEIEIITSQTSESPKINDKVPIIIYHYDNGQKEYRINSVEWLLYN